MKTGAMRQVQKEMKVLTVTEISTMVPASAILPITVKTGNNALIVCDSMHRKTEAAHRRLTAVTALIARASMPRVANVRNALMEILIVRVSTTTARKVSVRSARMATASVLTAHASMPKAVNVRNVRVSTRTPSVATAIRPVLMASVRSVHASIRMRQANTAMACSNVPTVTTTANARNVRASTRTVDAVTIMGEATHTVVRNVRVRQTITRMPSTARRNR